MQATPPFLLPQACHAIISSSAKHTKNVQDLLDLPGVGFACTRLSTIWLNDLPMRAPAEFHFWFGNSALVDLCVAHHGSNTACTRDLGNTTLQKASGTAVLQSVELPVVYKQASICAQCWLCTSVNITASSMGVTDFSCGRKALVLGLLASTVAAHPQAHHAKPSRWRANANVTYPYQNASLCIDERLDDLISRMTVAEKAGQLFHTQMVSLLSSATPCWRKQC